MSQSQPSMVLCTRMSGDDEDRDSPVFEEREEEVKGDGESNGVDLQQTRPVDAAASRVHSMRERKLTLAPLRKDRVTMARTAHQRKKRAEMEALPEVPSKNASSRQPFKSPAEEQQKASLTDLEAHPDMNVSDKHSLCLATLLNGYISSYVDFFYLTHRSDADAGEMSLQNLQFVQAHLTDAEQAHRVGEPGNMLQAYQKLADFFQETGDFRTGIYFYEKCLDIAQNMGDLAQQGNCNLNLGLAYDRMGDTATSIKFHERHIRIATELNDTDRLEAANQQLVLAYRLYAEEHERKRDHKGAVVYYKKCLASAVDSNDLKAEGIATYRLGAACSNLGDRTQSIEYQQRHLDICKRNGDHAGEGIACAALAHSFKELGDKKLAIKYLEKVLELSTRHGQQLEQAEACGALGAVHSSQGQLNKALVYFEKTYEIARSVGEKKLIDSSRINLGIARGNIAMMDYMEVVATDLPSLLSWKTKRFLDSSKEPSS